MAIYGEFFEIGLSAYLGKENQLVKLGKLLDWRRFFCDTSRGVHKEEEAPDQLRYPEKSLLLSQWHSLSDSGLEQSLRIRLAYGLDFLEFSGFSLGDNLPDETTFCRFRNKLVKQNIRCALVKQNIRCTIE